jgi:hypothetical protein
MKSVHNPTVNDLRDIVTNKACAMFVYYVKTAHENTVTRHIFVDTFSASAMVQCHDKLTLPENRAKFERMIGTLHGLVQLQALAMKHTGG